MPSEKKLAILEKKLARLEMLDDHAAEPRGGGGERDRKGEGETQHSGPFTKSGAITMQQRMEGETQIREGGAEAARGGRAQDKSFATARALSSRNLSKEISAVGLTSDSENRLEKEHGDGDKEGSWHAIGSKTGGIESSHSRVESTEATPNTLNATPTDQSRDDITDGSSGLRERCARGSVIQGALELVAAQGAKTQQDAHSLPAALPPLKSAAISRIDTRKENEYDETGRDIGSPTSTQEEMTSMLTSTTISEAAFVIDGREDVEGHGSPFNGEKFQHVKSDEPDNLTQGGDQEEELRLLHADSPQGMLHEQGMLEQLILDLGAAAQSERERRLVLEAKFKMYESAICLSASPYSGNNAGPKGEGELSNTLLREHDMLLAERKRLSAKFSDLQGALREDGRLDHHSEARSSNRKKGDRVESMDESFTLDPLVAMWLKQLGLLDLSGEFARECIDRSSLAMLTHSQLLELGVLKMGDRTKLLRRAVHSLVSSGDQTSQFWRRTPAS